MNDEQLNELLKQLPRHDSSSGFTGRVLARVDETRNRTAMFPWAAAAALISTVTVAGLTGHYFIEQQQQRQKVEAFRAEKQKIVLELQELKRLAEQSDPVFYLGGNEDAEYVIDLRAVEFDPGQIRPASYSTVAQ